MTPRVYIGIDLAWTQTNPSAMAVISDDFPTPELLALHLVTTLEDMVSLIFSYQNDHDIIIGVDAPLRVPNRMGNRETEKAFLRDFSRFKIGMLPVNRSLLERMFGSVRGEELLRLLEAEGFGLSPTAAQAVVEVYPHSTIAVCFNNNRLLPYKRKKGRSLADVKTAMKTYQHFLRAALYDHPVFNVDIETLKGQALKTYEDKLDGITSAYALWYCRHFPKRCKTYRTEGEGVFVTPFPSL
jgi:predicted RNase H-like nuclease